MEKHLNPQHRDFRAFEQTGWQQVADCYHDYFASLTTQALEPLLDAAGAGAGARLLDVATGPGYGAAAAAQRGALAWGMDFSARMIAQARRQYPGVPFVVGDAEEFPFAPDRFDAVITNFGLLHLARPERALQEARRVLRSGGRVVFTVWAPPEEAVGFGIVLHSIQAHGSLEVPLPAGPPFFRFSDPEECRQVLRAAGFSETAVSRAPQRWRLPDPDALFQAMTGGTVRTGGLLRAQSPLALRAIRDAMRRAVEAYKNAESFDLPMPAILASAVKP